MHADRAAAADLAACAALLRQGSKSFAAASLLLPAPIRSRATALYAFCRVADDAVDLAPGREAAALHALRCRLDRIYAGTPEPHPVDRALGAVVRAQLLPRAPLDALLEGFAWDAEGRRYETLEEVIAYSVRVAGSVGVAMTLLMGRREDEVLARACDLGVAMQLTNIARDVGEDARAGRLYLPQAWLRATGIDPQGFLAAPRHSVSLGAVVERLLAEAERLYRRSSAGIASLPRGCRPAIRAAGLVYAAIGSELRRRRYDAISHRAVVPTRRKLLLLARSTAALAWRQRRCDLPPLDEARFLVEACSERGGLHAA